MRLCEPGCVEHASRSPEWPKAKNPISKPRTNGYAELKTAKDELYWAGQENEFLKKAAGFFAAEQRPKRGSQ
ncbi:MAG: hypothetical protein R2733_17215 [Acidimicrobiales bacterium]